MFFHPAIDLKVTAQQLEEIAKAANDLQKTLSEKEIKTPIEANIEAQAVELVKDIDALMPYLHNSEDSTLRIRLI